VERAGLLEAAGEGESVTSQAEGTATPRAVPRQRRGGGAGDALFRALTLAFALVVLVILGGVIASLVEGAWPALAHFGAGFVFAEVWNPVTGKFGALAPIYGTLVTAAIAMLVGIPVAFGIALFITELCPVWLKRPLATMIELLAAIPSIIYGIWGLFVLAPFLQEHVEPALVDTLGNLPVIGALFAGPPLGIGVLTAGFILAIMVLPFISSIMRDVFETVPPVLRESAFGLGATTAEVVWRVVLPYTRIGVVGGILLGLGRALGETMAVTFVIGNSHHVHASLLQPGTTISAALANEFTEAVGDLYLSSLIALGLILFLITFIVLALAKLLLIRLQKQAGG
jgi:phosphate transport system permease protein